MNEIKLGRVIVDSSLLPLVTYVKKPVIVMAMEAAGGFTVNTLEGTMRGKKGDFLVRGIEGEFYPCKRSIFLKTYEKVGR